MIFIFKTSLKNNEFFKIMLKKINNLILQGVNILLTAIMIFS